jgi:hypothetical protein
MPKYHLPTDDGLIGNLARAKVVDLMPSRIGSHYRTRHASCPGRRCKAKFKHLVSRDPCQC